MVSRERALQMNMEYPEWIRVFIVHRSNHTEKRKAKLGWMWVGRICRMSHYRKAVPEEEEEASHRCYGIPCRPVSMDMDRSTL